MQLGQTREVIEVTGEAAAVNTEDSKLANTVAISQVANLPLNGRNVYDLIQLAPGAVNVRGVVCERRRQHGGQRSAGKLQWVSDQRLVQ